MKELDLRSLVEALAPEYAEAMGMEVEIRPLPEVGGFELLARLGFSLSQEAVDFWNQEEFPQVLLDPEGKVWIRDLFLIPEGLPLEEVVREALETVEAAAFNLFFLQGYGEATSALT